MGNVFLLPYQFRVQLDVLVLLQQLELELLAADVGDAGVGLKKKYSFWGKSVFNQNGQDSRFHRRDLFGHARSGSPEPRPSCAGYWQSNKLKFH